MNIRNKKYLALLLVACFSLLPFQTAQTQDNPPTEPDNYVELSSVNRHIFTGHVHDAKTGLIYFGQRHYDPDTGRFITQDPYLGEPNTPPSLHRYLYAYGNPTVYVDEHGNAAVVGAVFNAALDAGIQGYLISTGRQESFDWKSLGVSAAGGAAGVGIANNINRLRKLGTVGKGVASVSGEAAVVAGDKVLRGENIEASDVVQSALFGVGVSKGLDKVGDAYRGVRHQNPQNYSYTSPSQHSSQIDEAVQAALAKSKSRTQAHLTIEQSPMNGGNVPTGYGSGSSAVGSSYQQPQLATPSHSTVSSQQRIQQQNQQLMAAHTQATNSGRNFWTNSTNFQGNNVFQRNDLINPNLVDLRTGLTNSELMKAGRAPIGPDGRPINLHHMIQRHDGAIAEVTDTFHKKNSGVIHINPPSIPSGINRKEFSKWRGDYWKNRANDFQGDSLE